MQIETIELRLCLICQTPENENLTIWDIYIRVFILLFTIGKLTVTIFVHDYIKSTIGGNVFIQIKRQ